MASFNVQGALNAGYTQNQIDEYMQQNNLQGTSSQGASSDGSQPQGGGGALPTIGGMIGTGLGFTAGAAIPGADLTGVPEIAGSTAGGAIGQAAGQGLQNLISGQPLGQNVGQQALSGGETGLVGGGIGKLAGPALGKLSDLLQPKLDAQGAQQAINETLANADANTANKQGVIESLLKQHFGTSTNPNTDLMPDVPASQQPKFQQALKQEILSQVGQTPSLNGSINFSDINSWMKGAKSLSGSGSTPEQQFMGKIGSAYQGVLEDAIPGIEKPFANYDSALQDAEAKAAGKRTGFIGKIESQLNQIPWWIKYPLLTGLLGKAEQGLSGGFNTVTGSSPNSNQSYYTNPYAQ